MKGDKEIITERARESEMEKERERERTEDVPFVFFATYLTQEHQWPWRTIAIKIPIVYCLPAAYSGNSRPFTRVCRKAVERYRRG